MSAMKAEVMARALPKDVTKVYLLNQDYLFGQSVQRDVKAFLAKLRPDVQVVGDELIPLGKVKDFSPYITKIKASGAQAADHRQLGPGHEPPDQGGHGCRPRPPLLHDVRPSRRRRRRRSARAATARCARSCPSTRTSPPRSATRTPRPGRSSSATQHTFDFYAAGFRTIFEFLQEAMNKASSSRPDEVRPRRSRA